MSEFMEFRFKPERLSRFELPDIGYPVPIASLDAVLAANGDVPFAVLLHWLQQYSIARGTDWKSLESTMDRFATLLAPPDERDQLAIDGNTWWLEIGSVDLAGPLVIIKRGEDLIAAIAKRDDGRLKIAAFRPLDTKSAGYLTGLSLKPVPPNGVAMRENNREYALDASTGIGNFYAADRGEPYLTKSNIGTQEEGVTVDLRALKDLNPRRPVVVAAELAVHHDISAIKL